MVATGSTPAVRYRYADGRARHIRRLSTTYPGGQQIGYGYGQPGEADDKLGRVQDICEVNEPGEWIGNYTGVIGHTFGMNHFIDAPELELGTVLMLQDHMMTVTGLGEQSSPTGPDYDYYQIVTVAETPSGSPATGTIMLLSVPLARYTRRGLSATMRIEYLKCGGEEPLEMTYIKQAGEPDGAGGDQYTGQDRFNRNIDIRWLRTGTSDHVDRIQYGFDRASNRLWRKNVVAEENWDELYDYDGLYQLPERRRGTLNGTNTGLTGTPLDQEQFTYDPTGNWDRYQTAADGSTTLDQSRVHNRGNEIVEIDESEATVGYDRPGNMTLMPKGGDWEVGQATTWDAWNRLVKIEEGETVVGRYRLRWDDPACMEGEHRGRGRRSNHEALLLQRPVAGAGGADRHEHEHRPALRVGVALCR